MRFWKKPGNLLIIIGVIHTIFTAVVFKSFVSDMVVSGIVNSVSDEPKSYFAVHWFLLSGYFWIIAGFLCNYIIQVTGQPLPRHFGVMFLAFGIIAVAFQPLSGAWVFVLLGTYVILQSRIKKTKKPNILS